MHLPLPHSKSSINLLQRWAQYRRLTLKQWLLGKEVQYLREKTCSTIAWLLENAVRLAFRTAFWKEEFNILAVNFIYQSNRPKLATGLFHILQHHGQYVGECAPGSSGVVAFRFSPPGSLAKNRLGCGQEVVSNCSLHHSFVCSVTGTLFSRQLSSNLDSPFWQPKWGSEGNDRSDQDVLNLLY